MLSALFTLAFGFFAAFALARLAASLAFAAAATLAAGTVGLLIAFPDRFEFVSDMPAWQPLAALAVAAALYFADAFGKLGDKRKYYGALAAASIIIALLPGTDFLLFEGALPLWLDRLAVAAILFALAAGYRFLDAVPVVVPTQTAGIAAGLCVVSLLDGAPVLLGLFALLLLGAAAAAIPFAGAGLRISSRAAPAVGLFIGWLLLEYAREFAAPCCLVLLLPLAVDAAWAAAKKYVLLKPEDAARPLADFSSFVRLRNAGAPAGQIAYSQIRICMLMVILAAFQVYAANAYSLPLLGAAFCGWYLSKVAEAASRPEQESAAETVPEPVRKPKPKKKIQKKKAK